ncbi:nucleoporin NUP188 homolog [Trichogramma pretiosum]|uniref:nucleoporin NUP188 homolog n=1 Tax=Trichogramma pretiosum TaxID=7493 RepID=UPI0006C9CE29|nr:nucleoporin NUP188 homolog [Trichogramma pretiosum]
MSVAPMGNLPYCKGLWSVISGTTCRCDKALVEDEIKSATAILQDGLSYFKTYTEESLQAVNKTNPPPKMYDLISKLAPLLNLDAKIAWDLVCNFMIYEYRNCPETFASQLTDLSTMQALIEQIWNFYYTERITLVKCLKLMVEYRENDSHPHKSHFVKFFDEVLFMELLESIRKQIEALKYINPPTRSQLFTEEHQYQLYNSCLIEMRELLHIFTIILHEVHVAENQFVNIYGSISGEPRRLTNSQSHEEKEAVKKKLQEIQYSQAALLIVGLDMMKHTGMEDWIREVRCSMEDVLQNKCVRDPTSQDGPLMLAWMLANYAIDPDNSETFMRYRVYGVKAIHLNVFYYLQQMLDSEMIKEKTQYATTVRGSIYNLLSLLCAFVDDEKFDIFPGIFEACASTLSFPESAERFWKEKEEGTGLWPIIKYSMLWFPYRFEPLTTIITGLSRASSFSAKKTLGLIENLPSIALEINRNYLNSNMQCRPYDQCFIHQNTFTIPSKCQFMKMHRDNGRADCELIVFKIKASFWDAFHHKIELLLHQASRGIANLVTENNVLLDQVQLGFGLLEALLSAEVDVSSGMVIPTELSFEVVHRFSYPVLPVNIYKVVAASFKVSSKLVLRYPEDVLSRMRSGVYPRFDDRYQQTTEFAQAVAFDGGLVASWLSSIETIQHAYPILDAYMDTLSDYLELRHSKEALYNIEIPGMIMLLQSVLPKLDSWYFRSELERVELWMKCVKCLHRSLDVVIGKKDETRSELRKIVTYNLMHLEPRHALLKLVRTGEKTLRNRMLGETDWIAGKGFKVMKTVQLALSVVNRLLMYRKNLGFNVDERSPLESALYASPSLPNALLIVPTIVDYLYVWFSPALQAMAVRLLKKFAEGLSMSLLVCMGMDGTAIRETFASRLMSPTCGAEVKVAILELVTVCLDKQPGLTEAMFNIMHQAERRRIFPRPADEFLTEGCTRFLDLYLKRVQKEDDIIYDRLYDSTMNLLRAMWHHRNEILVNFFRKRPEFWSKLFAPLLRKLVPGVKGYSQLLDIITIELFKSPSFEKDFTMNLDILLDDKSNHWDNLVKYIFDSIPPPPPNQTNQQDEKMDDGEDDELVLCEKEASMKPLYETNLESWYQMMVVLTSERTSRNHSVSPRQAKLTTGLVLDQLLIRLKVIPPTSKRARLSAGKLTMLLGSIALRCLNSWKSKCMGSDTSSSDDLKNKLVESMQEISQTYRAYGKGLRQTLISLLLHWLDLVEDSLINDEAMLEYLLGQACILACGDIEQLRESARIRDKKRKPFDKDTEPERLEAEEVAAVSECVPATLTVCLVTRLLRFKIERSKTNRCKPANTLLRQLLPELLICLGITLQKHAYMKFSKAALMLLSVITGSFFGPLPIDEESIAKLWLALIPPKDIKNSLQDSLYEDCPSSRSRWQCQEWWPLYTAGLEFIIALINGPDSNTSTRITQIVLFLGSHEHLLTEASTLLRHTADPVAADLILSLVNLISALSCRSTFWKSLHLSIKESLTKSMYLSYDSTVNLLLRPRILKFIIDGISVESAEELQSCDERQLSAELRLLVNKLILINTCCAQSFVRFSPKLNALVDSIHEQEDFWYAPMAEMNFGPPQMSMTSGPRLTYGAIISATQLFTQAQWQVMLRTSGGSHHQMQPPRTKPTSPSIHGRDDRIDSARREWERATPENLRRMHAKDLRQILNPTMSTSSLGPSIIASGSSSKLDFSNYLSAHDLTVPLLSAPRLIKRPFDPLICENMILSKATALGPLGSRSRRATSPGPAKVLDTSARGRSPAKDGSGAGNANGSSWSDPWFDSMDENNTRLALEVNLVLLLCQALEGVRSPRLAIRDKQLIVRETATELGVFFDFLDNRGYLNDWSVSASLVDPENDRCRIVLAPEDTDRRLPARLDAKATFHKVPKMVAMLETIDEEPLEVSRSESYVVDVITTGCFPIRIDMSKFLPLLGKLLKSVVESLDSAQFGC